MLREANTVAEAFLLAANVTDGVITAYVSSVGSMSLSGIVIVLSAASEITSVSA